jgi:hypothetical protein
MRAAHRDDRVPVPVQQDQAAGQRGQPEAGGLRSGHGLDGLADGRYQAAELRMESWSATRSPQDDVSLYYSAVHPVLSRSGQAHPGRQGQQTPQTGVACDWPQEVPTLPGPHATSGDFLTESAGVLAAKRPPKPHPRAP